MMWGATAASVAAPSELPAAHLRAGRAQVKITPPVGSMIGNSYGITVARGVTSDLHAKAVVFAVGETKAALVACDLISLHRPIVERTRALIAQRSGLDPQHVILCATHAHSGPQTHPLLLELGDARTRELSEAYVRELPALIAESVVRAEKDLQPARISVARAREDSISFNRRFLLRDGSVRMNPGRNNPEVVRAMGPIDPEVGVVYVEALDGQPLVTLVNFALHVAIVGGDRVSADYPHTLARALAAVKGEEMVTIFTNGMAGNINHIDVRRREELRGEAEAARVGTILAAAVLKAFKELKPVGATTLRAASRAVRLPAPTPAHEAVEEARRIMRGHGKGAPFPAVINAWRIIDQAELSRGGAIESEVQVISLGRELALVGYPGDSFVELGFAMKQNSPFQFTFVAEQSGNGALSYIPNRAAYPQGGYEVDSARLAPGGGELLAEAAVALLVEHFATP